jgi:hypothetical protein
MDPKAGKLKAWDFRGFWRKIATAADIPNNIQNRDSRPGAATEADLGADRQDAARAGPFKTENDRNLFAGGPGGEP